MSWYQLLSSVKANREQQAQERRQVQTMPTVCPIDGTILEQGPGNTRHCALGNFTWPSGTRLPHTSTEAS